MFTVCQDKRYTSLWIVYDLFKCQLKQDSSYMQALSGGIVNVEALFFKYIHFGNHKYKIPEKCPFQEIHEILG